MALSGFEGFEKRLELHFSSDDSVIGLGLRRLHFQSLKEILNTVQCTVVSALGNQYFDAYVLSESSLFVYPTKIIIKTCGTIQLLKSIAPFLSHAHQMGLTLCGCRYTRGSFIFPESQPYPHTSFRDEVFYLEQNLPTTLCYRKASIMHTWHVYSASDDDDHFHYHHNMHDDDVFTIEVCMTELDRVLTRKFYKDDVVVVDAKRMTELTGIGAINPKAYVCDFAFDPCGYSMNGVDGTYYSTIHVTPEDGYSYASFECVGCKDDCSNLDEVLKKVVHVFGPAKMSVSVTCGSHDMLTRVTDALEPLGLKCRSCIVDEFPGVGSVVYQMFTTRRK